MPKIIIQVGGDGKPYTGKLTERALLTELRKERKKGSDAYCFLDGESGGFRLLDNEISIALAYLKSKRPNLSRLGRFLQCLFKR